MMGLRRPLDVELAFETIAADVSLFARRDCEVRLATVELICAVRYRDVFPSFK